MTAPDSTAVYPEPEFNKLLGYVGQIKQVGKNHGFSACVVGKSNARIPMNVPYGGFPGRLMSFFGKPLPAHG